jgi:flagellar motor switch protein FliN
MTEAAGPQLNPELNAWLEGWEKCMQVVLSQITGQPVAFDSTAEALPGAESDLWFTVTVGGTTRGEMALRMSVATGVRLAQKLLMETEPAPEEPTADHKDALQELLRQVAGQAATALASAAGGEIQLHLAASAAPSWSPSGIKSLHTRDEAGTPVDIEIQVSAALAAALATPAKTPPPEAQSALPSAAAHYERLRDVILEVKLRFGSRRMVLRDVLALSAGVVVELDSNVTAPVDLLLDGRVVAQGDVVVVDGKYGLRVTQVLDSRSPC